MFTLLKEFAPLIGIVLFIFLGMGIIATVANAISNPKEVRPGAIAGLIIMAGIMLYLIRWLFLSQSKNW